MSTSHPDATPLTELEMLERSSRAIGKIAYRFDGVFLLSEQEIEAMAMTLLLLGVPVIKPGEPLTDPYQFYKNLAQRNGVKL